MDNYREKFNYLMLHQDSNCAFSGERFTLDDNIDIHHLAHNTKWRRKSFPLFLNSIINLRLLHHSVHLSNPSCLKIFDLQAEKYEKFLERHPQISKWVNNPV